MSKICTSLVSRGARTVPLLFLLGLVSTVQAAQRAPAQPQAQQFLLQVTFEGVYYIYTGEVANYIARISPSVLGYMPQVR